MSFWDENIWFGLPQENNQCSIRKWKRPVQFRSPWPVTAKGVRSHLQHSPWSAFKICSHGNFPVNRTVLFSVTTMLCTETQNVLTFCLEVCPSGPTSPNSPHLKTLVTTTLVFISELLLLFFKILFIWGRARGSDRESTDGWAEGE